MKASNLLWIPLLGVSGCMVDFYGGNPRLQLADGSRRWTLLSAGLGDTARPAWTRSFDPPVVRGGSTEVMDLPVAGDLTLFLRLRDTLGEDSAVWIHLKEDIGDFRKLEIGENSSGALDIR